MTLREALRAVHETHGKLTPALVVETARDGKDDVARFLHDKLTWDDEQAGERWRLEEAQRLIQKMKVVYSPSPRSSIRETREFVSITTPDGPVYHPIDEVALDPLMTQMLLQEAERNWRDMKARYGHLTEFIQLVRRDLEQEQDAA